MNHRMIMMAAACLVLFACAARPPKVKLGQIAVTQFRLDGNVSQVTRYNGPMDPLGQAVAGDVAQYLKRLGRDAFATPAINHTEADTIVSGNITRLDGGSRGGRLFASALFGFGWTSWGIGGSSCRLDGEVQRRDGTRIGAFGVERKRKATGYFWIRYGESSERQLRACLESASVEIGRMIDNGTYSGSRLLTIATPQDRQERNIRSPADRLRDLESLRERGLVTEEEYKQKRQRILDEF